MRRHQGNIQTRWNLSDLRDFSFGPELSKAEQMNPDEGVLVLISLLFSLSEGDQN